MSSRCRDGRAASACPCGLPKVDVAGPVVQGLLLVGVTVHRDRFRWSSQNRAGPQPIQRPHAGDSDQPCDGPT